jgi:membrane protease YdiL (CAAX protease family)
MMKPNPLFNRCLIFLLLPYFISGGAYAVSDSLPSEPVPVPPLEISDLSPAAVGWGNLIVPGLGATLRGQPGRGLIEAVVELGLFYGGTFGVREGAFTIDTTVVTPERGNLTSPLLGQALQQFGIKIHMYDTFYHYQQVSLARADLASERENPQPLYKGTWSDTLLAPFRWKNLSEPWVWGLLVAAAGVLLYDYKTTTVSRSFYHPSGAENTLEGLNDMLVVPLGSSFGEEVLFRGFVLRELRQYTGSLLVADLLQASAFMCLHPPANRAVAFGGGLYFGFLADHYKGNLEPGIAAHFWIDAISGLFSYLAFQRAQGKDTPFEPPLGMTIAVPF